MKNLRLILFCALLTLSFTSCSGKEAEISEEKVLKIAYAEPITNYSPFAYSAKDRRYLVNMYDPLVRYDESFNVETALALSWGRIDDLTWEFRLRDGVFFHDGTEMDSADVIYSLEFALNDSNSELKSLLSSISEFEAVEANKVQIKTFEPDPLLLNRMTNLFIVPENTNDFSIPNGSGAYYFENFENNSLILKSFTDYWGQKVHFNEVHLVYEPSANARYEGILNGDFQFLANVPPQFVGDLKSKGIEVLDFPSLETSFLIFNTGGIFADKDIRNSAWSALSHSYSETFGSAYLETSNQYASRGIMGYVQDWGFKMPEFSILGKPVNIELDMPEGTNSLGIILAEELAKANFKVDLNILPLDEFEEKIYSGESDLYFFGWKYDFADVSEFFEAVLYSKGEFNFSYYENEEIDSLIEMASKTLNVNERRELLEQISILAFEDQFALPLFESKVLYGIAPGLEWELRLDSMIMASEISGNVL